MGGSWTFGGHAHITIVQPYQMDPIKTPLVTVQGGAKDHLTGVSL